MLGIIRYVGINGNSVEDNALRSKCYVATHRQLESFWVINGPRKLGHVKVDKLDSSEISRSSGAKGCQFVPQSPPNTCKHRERKRIWEPEGQYMLWEADRFGQGRSLAIEIQCEDVWAWSTWPDQQPLPRARCNQFEVYCKVWVQWDYWQIEEGLAMLEKEWHLRWVPVSMAQIIPRIDWEWPVHSYLLTEGWSVSVQEMAPVSPRLSCSTVCLLPNEARSHIHNWCAQVQQ